MNEQELKHLVEAVLLAAGRPVTSAQLLDLFEGHDRPSPEQLQSALEALTADYEVRGIELQLVASGWRIQVRARCVEMVSRLWQERPAKYSRALLETLALIAYRQPITRAEIEAVRGVAVSSTIMRTLQERNWIRVVGHREVPGRPEVLGTTRDFLDYFGLKKLEDLPSLAALNEFETVGVQLELPGANTTDEVAATTTAAEPAASGASTESATSSASGEVAVTEVASSEAVAEAEAASGATEALEATEASETATEVASEDLAEAQLDSSDGLESSDIASPEPKNAAAAEDEEEATLLAAPEEDAAHAIEEPPVDVESSGV